MGILKTAIPTIMIFATNNAHKVEEIRAALGGAFELQTLKEAGIDIDIPEPYDTLEANAAAKARTIVQLTGLDAFAEDTGLEVTSLQGEPGVRSARYAGEERDDAANMRKLLDRLEGQTDRSARFRTVMVLIMNGIEYSFEGICPGQIALQTGGTGGFGYDPLFIPDGSSLTFAEMGLEEKNIFSHRRKALDQLITFCKNKRYGQGKN
jgi:XTP/dITP diphosphohydrolase